jgi:beta-xylosidase
VGQVSHDGTVYDATRHPNTVDPNVFSDNARRLWMIFGSYSGGIFIMQMNPGNGMPLPGQGYGKRLMGGNHSRIEGAYVMYSPATSHYYLFTSFGGLDANGGYNMRVARSLRPDGPYLDARARTWPRSARMRPSRCSTTPQSPRTAVGACEPRIVRDRYRHTAVDRPWLVRYRYPADL